MTVTTRPFRVPGTTILGSLAMRHALWWITGLALTFLLLLAIGIFEDVRFLIIALMMVCIVAPMMAAMLYITHGMKQATALNPTYHDATVSSDAITITIYTQEEKSEDDNTAANTSGSNCDLTTDSKMQKARQVIFPISDVTSYEAGGTGIWLCIDKGKKGYIFIPYNTFASPDQLKTVISILSA